MNKLVWASAAALAIHSSMSMAVVGTTMLGCGGSGRGKLSSPSGAPVASLTVTSKSFPPNGNIPVDFTCDGSDKSPHLTWSSPPAGTKSFALVVEDPDASSGAFTHWILFDIPGDALVLPEAVDPGAIGAKVGVNDYHNLRYNGPCPPPQELHRYVFRLYALDTSLDLPEGASKDALFNAMAKHVLAEGTLVGTFSH